MPLACLSTNFRIRAAQIPQPVLPEIPQARPFGEAFAGQLLRRRREQNLAAMTGIEQARYPAERETGVVPRPLLGNAGVQRHPHPKFRQSIRRCRR